MAVISFWTIAIVLTVIAVNPAVPLMVLAMLV